VSLAASPIDPDAPRERPDAQAPEPAAETGVLEEGEDPDDLFVSCVPEKGVVTRFGATGSAFIGAKRDATVTEGGIRYFPDQVLKIPGADVRRYSREYTRVLAEGALKRHSREQHQAYRVKRDEALRAGKAQREQARADALAAAQAREAEAAQAAAGDATKTDPALAAGNETPAAPAPKTTGE
jgi:hypothetical protein